MKSQEYENTNMAFIKDLNKVHHHYESKLPFQPNDTMIMYYNNDDESFHYFTKNSNIQYKVLNSVCRSYLLHIRCLNLFKDETDLERICPCNDEDFEKIEESSESEDEKEAAQDNEEIAVSHSTECFFFHQFIAIHQESPNLVRSDSVFNDQISKINTYLNRLTDKKAAANENSEMDPTI